MSEQIQIYTDGSAIGNPGFGGWAAVICQGKRRREITGGSSYATSAEMEITAAIKALESTEKASKVIIYSDSQYLIQGMRYLAQRWERFGWKDRNGKPLVHRAIWKHLTACARGRAITWVWIRGHNGHPFQCRADKLAFHEARQQQKLMVKAADCTPYPLCSIPPQN